MAERQRESRAERVASLRRRVENDPYDAASWEDLVQEADRARRGPERNQELASVYEDLLKIFPTAAGYWRDYADFQTTCATEAEVKGVFSRCLLTCLSVDLWRAYLNFIKRINEGRGAEGLPEVRQAYEFTLDRLGQDTACGGVWLDYIAFLAAPRHGSPEYGALFGEALEGQEDSAKSAALRRAYQRALVVPTPQLEGLWRGYEGFEMGGSNKQLARRLLDEWRPRYQAARTLLREREGRLAALNLKAMALPPGRGGATQQQQAALWRDYLEWERGNPQHLDAPTYVARVALAFEQALMVLFHYPDIWLEFARWHAGSGGGAAAAAAVLDKGRRALPPALALHFAAADLAEAGGELAGAKAVYEELVEGLRAPEEAGAAATAAAPAASPAAAAAPAAAPKAEPAAEGGAQQAAQTKQEAVNGEQQGQQAADGKSAAAPPPPPPPAQQQQQSPKQEAALPQAPPQQTAAAQQAQQAGMQLSEEAGTLAWIQYMRFARRAEGIMAARKLFMRARKWPAMGWQAYAASALMEWRHEAKDTIPRNIFELGLKSHLGQPGLVLAYADFLLGLGDTHNTRALFERALTATAPEAAPPLWDAYVQFEYDVGTLAAAAAVEARRVEAATALREAAAAIAAGAALDGKAAPPASAAKPLQHEALHLALLKYKVQGLWPATDVQKLCFERLLGQAPALESGDRLRDHDSRREREPRRHRSPSPRRHRSPSPRRHRSASPRRGGGERERSGHAPRSPARENEPLRLSRELALLMNQLPPAHKLEGPVPDVERVIQVIMAADLSPDGIINHEIQAARERRRQRRLAEMGPPGAGGPPGGPPGAPGAYAGGPGGMAGQKRKSMAEYDSGSDSDYEDPHHGRGHGGHGAGGHEAAAAPGGGADAGGGLDIYRMRRKQQRA
ncbi:Suf-domain-containing [Micractinium conductrix]|uniref:Suf-domain-containing n=1 Tax=Micractinium conductrix TaxID=554055 RepID=A0A2P6VHY9_9CHLO|nr:Suf-domain-containing [Micractinium conductrix]|eukprot:PSC73688.1 Suf-domain-containing [Micractinium conductrix]